MRDQRAEANAEIAHQERHREALTGEAAGESGVCPTCHRELEGTIEDLLAGFDTAIADGPPAIATRSTASSVDWKRRWRRSNERPNGKLQLQAELETLGDLGTEAALAAEAARAKERWRRRPRPSRSSKRRTRRSRRRSRSCGRAAEEAAKAETAGARHRSG